MLSLAPSRNLRVVVSFANQTLHGNRSRWDGAAPIAPAKA
jgi:hypothetical protein